MSETFYRDIAPVHHILDITDPRHYHDVPDDWHIALTDVMGSTRAIQEGRYKEVNAIAAASITALMNQMPHIDLPFVFGGDGATVLIPPGTLDLARVALLATRQRAQTMFGLALRVGLVPVRVVLDAGYRIRVTRLHVSENYQQAIFSGGGISYAERLLKAPDGQYLIAEDGAYEADFTGFECRWSEVTGRHSETLSVIVSATDADPNRTYREVLESIEHIYGDPPQRHPLTVRSLRLNLLPHNFYIEARLRFNQNSLRRLWILARNTVIAGMAMRLDIGGWGRYKRLLVEASDVEKFDDTLRMVISGSAAQRERLVAALDALHRQRRLVYGVHVTTRALVTCLIFDYFGRQVHFVDGADGGYALAAKAMKSQLQAQQPPP